MPLATGTRLGPYEILSLIGAGGMGEVYRARDTRLDRDVALKILPESVAADPDRLMRFEREAKTLATLSHPHIAQIHGLEVSANTRALVMELVEGEDLAQRLARGPIPIDEALPIARQVADALEAAHDVGIIHRDLKPANIKLRRDGAVKVLDFGLAKALDSSAAHPVPTESPTITSPAMTQAGIILGTAAYMSPEQARGKRVDQRADIWAFGCVLFEMLTGRQAFSGDAITDVLAKVIERDPDWTALPPSAPAPLRALLRRCLAKDAAKRWHHIADVRLELDEAIAAPAPDAAPPIPRSNRWRERVAWVTALLMVLIAAGVAARWLSSRTTLEVTTFQIYPAAGQYFGSITYFALSPDGRRIVYQAGPPVATNSLWVHSLDRGDAHQLPQTGGATSPFWSPDGRSVAFFAAGRLLKSELTGGSPLVICDLPHYAEGGSWSNDGTILFGTPAGIYRVPANGGAPVPVTTTIAPEATHHWPVWLPDQRHFLYFSKSSVFYASIDGEKPAKVLNADGKVEFAAPDTILFPRGDTLMAQRFDARRGEVTGMSVRIVDQVPSGGRGRADYSVSQGGTLLYRPASSYAAMQWRLYDTSGRPLRSLPLTQIRSFALSPDGRFLAAHAHETNLTNGELWQYDLARDAPSRITAGDAHDDYPVWSPDGRRIVVASSRDGGGIWLIDAANGAFIERLLKDPRAVPSDWSRDGRWLVYHFTDPKTRRDIWVLPMTGDRTPRPLVQTPFDERTATLSPDARWLAYTSDETGRPEVYLQPFPPVGRKTPASTAGGSHPRWDPRGRVLYYWDLDGRVMRVRVSVTGSDIEPDTAEPVFTLRTTSASYGTNADRFPYVVAPDGAGFIGVEAPSSGLETPLTVVLNWRSLLGSSELQR